MTQASNIFIKDTIIKLLTAIGSEKEIKKYINKFSSTEQQFAVIKVGGAVVEEDLDNLISSLVFLNQVGLRPIIIHGGGPGLSKELDAKNIDFSFIDGQRVTSEAVRDVAINVFGDINSLLVRRLNEQGALAIGFKEEIFKSEKKSEDLGYVGEIKKVNIKPINEAIKDGFIPVISPLGITETNEVVNINADVATINLVEKIKPYKVVFLSQVGGIYDNNESLIQSINLDLEYEEMMNADWLHSGMQLKLKQIKELLDLLPRSSSVSITKPIDLPKELFTDSGSGTLIKRGHGIDIFESKDQDIQKKFFSIIESSFDGILNKSFFNDGDYKIFMTTCERAAIAVSMEYKVPYMDKFGVIAEAKGEGIGSAIFHEMKKEFPEIFWRSKSNNPINKFYLSMADGYQKTGEWDIFWMGIDDYSKLNECINFAVSKQQTISY